MSTAFDFSRRFCRSSHQTRITPFIAVERNMARLLPIELRLPDLPLSICARTFKGEGDFLHIEMDAHKGQDRERCQGQQDVEPKVAHRRHLSAFSPMLVKESADAPRA